MQFLARIHDIETAGITQLRYLKRYRCLHNSKWIIDIRYRGVILEIFYPGSL